MRLVDGRERTPQGLVCAPEAVGERLRSARARIGATQEALADHLRVTPRTVQRWEAGHVRPDLDTIERLASVLGTSPSHLVWPDP